MQGDKIDVPFGPGYATRVPSGTWALAMSEDQSLFLKAARILSKLAPLEMVYLPSLLHCVWNRIVCFGAKHSVVIIPDVLCMSPYSEKPVNMCLSPTHACIP